MATDRELNVKRLAQQSLGSGRLYDLGLRRKPKW